jgi:hypothetical protein
VHNGELAVGTVLVVDVVAQSAPIVTVEHYQVGAIVDACGLCLRDVETHHSYQQSYGQSRFHDAKLGVFLQKKTLHRNILQVNKVPQFPKNKK